MKADMDQISLPGGSSVGLVCDSVRASALTFGDVVTIHQDGRVEINPAYETTEAARAFWQAVRAAAPLFFQHENPPPALG